MQMSGHTKPSEWAHSRSTERARSGAVRGRLRKGPAYGMRASQASPFRETAEPSAVSAEVRPADAAYAPGPLVRRGTVCTLRPAPDRAARLSCPPVVAGQVTT